jgi:hypothetical protein
MLGSILHIECLEQKVQQVVVVRYLNGLRQEGSSLSSLEPVRPGGIKKARAFAPAP